MAPGTIEQCFEAGHRALQPGRAVSDAGHHPERPVPPNAIRTSRHGRASTSTQVDDRPGRAAGLRGPRPDHRGVRPPPPHRERHLATGDPRPPNAVYITTGDEHTAVGHNTEESDDRIEQMDKRMRKLDQAAQGDAAAHLVRPRERRHHARRAGAAPTARCARPPTCSTRRATPPTSSSSWTCSRWTRTASPPSSTRSGG